MNDTTWRTLAFSARGRLNRQRFWAVTGCLFLVNIAVSVLEAALRGGASQAPGIIGGLLDLAAAIVLIWVSLAIGIKRFHDRNKSGYWLLLSFIPIIGTIWVFVETGFLRGSVGTNDYGPDPLTPHADIVDVFNAPPPPPHVGRF